MKFLCLDCDEPMRLLTSSGPDEGSLTVTFRCPECGFRVAMLTNSFETQMIRSLGVKVGGQTETPRPFEDLRASLAQPAEGNDAGSGDAGQPDPSTGGGSGCPFAAMVADQEGDARGAMPWSPAAEARVDRIPAFIRPMARKAIERYAESRGYPSITEAVMDEARSALGM
jgi:DNA-directed RNA polymerase subunit RPC12/RpoP